MTKSMARSKLVQAKYNFDIASENGVHTITYKKAKYGLSTLFSGMVMLAIMTAIPAGLISNGGFWVFCTFVVPVIVFITANAMRRKAVFHISPESYSVNGKRYDRSHIYDLYIKMPYIHAETVHIERNRTMIIGYGGDRVSQIGVNTALAVTGGVHALMEGASAISQGAAGSIKRQYIKKNFSIGFLFGEKRIALAKGLSETTAEVLFRKVAELSEA